MEVALVMLLGLPGSGKTSFAKHLIENVNDLNLPVRMQSKIITVFHICYDSLITQFQNEDTISWTEARKKILKLVESVIHFLKEIPSNFSGLQDCVKRFSIATSYGHNIPHSHQVAVIVVDDNMYYRSMRYEYYKLAKTFHISFCQIYIQCNLNIARKRNSMRTQAQVSDEIIVNMCEKLRQPDIKNLWEKYYCSISSEEPYTTEDARLAFSIIEDAINDPENSAPREGIAIQPSPPNIIHEADLALRRIVGEKIKKHPVKDKFFIETLHTKKNFLMEELKRGALKIPDDMQLIVTNSNPNFQNELQKWFLDFF